MVLHVLGLLDLCYSLKMVFFDRCLSASGCDVSSCILYAIVLKWYFSNDCVSASGCDISSCIIHFCPFFSALMVETHSVFLLFSLQSCFSIKSSNR